MDSSPLDRLARSLDALRTRRSAAALLGGLITPPIIALGDAEAGPKQKRKKRRGPAGEATACKERCRKKKSKQARRRCRRRCQGDQSGRACDTDRDCAPCARCQRNRCVTTCQTGEVCQNDRCTPDPDICPAQGAEVVVASYSEVKDDFAQGSALALPAAPDAVANFVHERFADLHDQFSPELQDLVSPEGLAEFAYHLQHNRVHFEVPLSIGVFDGDLEDDVIQGYFTQIFTLSFWITRTTPLSPEAESPLEGQWEGVIYDPTGVLYPTPFDIVVTFTRVSGELTGTLDVLGILENDPITAISFSEHRPLSTEPSGDVSISPQPNWTRYATLVGWGSYAMAFTFWVEPQGQIIGFDIVPDWPVPPDPAAGMPVETVIRLPVNGVWSISTGGPRQFQNHHLSDPASRHALDFALWNESGFYLPNYDENADSWGWEQPVFAPAAGTVVDMANDVPDNLLGVADTSSPGNMIVLQTAPQEFLLMAHFRHGSVVVAAGEQVQEGQFLARIGNSGYSNGPHLHMQLQDRTPYPFDPETISLPFRFKDLLVNGRPEANPSPEQFDFVQHAGCPIPVPAEFALPPERNRPNRSERGNQERSTVTQSRADWFRSPAALPVDGPPSTPWGNR